MGTKYTFKQEFKPEFNPYGAANPTTVTVEMEGDLNLTQVLERFEDFLRGAGFYFDGHLDIVLDDCSVNDELTLTFPDGTEEVTTHSVHYYDDDRNK